MCSRTSRYSSLSLSKYQKCSCCHSHVCRLVPRQRTQQAVWVPSASTRHCLQLLFIFCTLLKRGIVIEPNIVCIMINTLIYVYTKKTMIIWYFKDFNDILLQSFSCWYLSSWLIQKLHFNTIYSFVSSRKFN